MKISKEQAQQNRERVVETAARLFRERGFDGIGVADLMQGAGFTHGGFYNHFASKNALAVDAVRAAFLQRATDTGPGEGIDDILARYLSPQHRDERGAGCPAAGLGGDAARQPDEVKGVFADGIGAMIQAFESAVGRDDLPAGERRALAVNLLAKAVGAVVLARAVPDDHALARELLESTLAGALREAQGTGAA